MALPRLPRADAPRRYRRATAVAVGAVCALGSVTTELHASATTAPTVSVSTVNGAAPGSLVKAKGSSLSVAGTASGLPAVSADAGPSLYLQQGDTATMYANAFDTLGPNRYAWTLDGSSTPFDNATALQPTLNTAGLGDGVHTAALTVTDSRGAVAHASTKVVVYRILHPTLADRSGTLSPNGALLTGTPVGSVPPPNPVRVPFTVAAGTSFVDLTLNYDQVSTPAATFGSFSVTVEDPSGVYNNDMDGSKGVSANPETMHLTSPAAGQWYADVTDNASAPNANYHLTVTSELITVADPRPHASSGGPYTFAVGATQQLHGASSGGAAPVSLSWDLDQTGRFSTAVASPTTSFGLGSHLVTLRAVDSAGYDSRDSTAVRVVTPGTAAPSPIVVVALADTGINPYHQDFGAALYPDKSILSRSNNFTADPATYIPGYPAGTPALPVHLGQGYDPAVDQPLWAPNGSTQLNKLYWIPGTKIVGAMDSGLGTGLSTSGSAPPPATILDTEGHGTASASVLAGNVHGSCPLCLLVAIKGLGGETWAYTQPWIDIVSNSYGALGDVGDAGTGLIGGPTFPQASAERGQIALYAAGNGNDDAFVTPEQTYTSNELGPDWVVRIGAVDRDTNQPFTGTGKPVSASSYGLGNIPAAAFDSTTGEVQHNGTSAATPISAGVMASTLDSVRAALGDGGVGQRPNAVIATGTPIAGSPYLADGQLTRAELVDAILHTAETGTENTSIEFPPTTPGNPAQFALEGYGILNTDTGALATNVLLGKAPVPSRATEDQFFALDSLLRQALWGTWSGGGTNSAQGSGSTSSQRVWNPFTGVTTAQVSNFQSALKLLLGAGAGGTGGAASSSSAPTVTLTAPANGTTLDAGSTTLAVSGTAAFPASMYPATANTFYLRRDNCGTSADNPHLSRQASTNDAGEGCAQILSGLSALGQPGVTGDFNVEYPLTATDLPVVLGSGVPVSGTIYEQAWNNLPSPSVTLDIELNSDGTTLADQVVTGAVTDPTDTTPGMFPFSFPVPDQFVGTVLDGLSLIVHVRSTQNPEYTELNSPASFVNLPLAAGSVPSGAQVQLSVDDPNFASPVVATVQPDMSFSASVPVGGLATAPSSHTLYARALAGSVSGSAASALFLIASANTPPPPAQLPGIVQLQLLPLGQVPSATGWVAATDGAGNGTYATWSAALDMSTLANGRYTLYTRILMTDGSVAQAPAIAIRKQ